MKDLDNDCGVVIYGFNYPFPKEVYYSSGESSSSSSSSSSEEDNERILPFPTLACFCPSHERIFGHYLTKNAPGLNACTVNGAKSFEGFPLDVSVSCLLRKQ